MIIASCEFREMTVWTKVTQNWLSTRVVKTENPKVFLFLYCTYFGHKNKILEFFSDSKRRFSMLMVIFHWCSQRFCKSNHFRKVDFLYYFFRFLAVSVQLFNSHFSGLLSSVLFTKISAPCSPILRVHKDF